MTNASESMLPEETTDAIVSAKFTDIFSVLGQHPHPDGKGLIARAFIPGASALEVVSRKDGKVVAELALIHAEGLFEGKLGRRRKQFAYRLRAQFDHGTVEMDDPYQYPSLLEEDDLYLFCEGTHERAYRWMGAHPRTYEGVAGTLFCVWAPEASRVSVVGDFNYWDGRRHVMRKHIAAGVWELFIPDVGGQQNYKYEITDKHGQLLPQKADPYAFAMQHPPQKASVTRAEDTYTWGDSAWMKARDGAADHHQKPISVYEVHAGSWRRKGPDGSQYLSYSELADELIPYVLEMGFTHLQLMPISEFPFDGSWGYQPIGLFSPTSRFGSPQELKRFVDRCHQQGISVLVDWVPGHFPGDDYGLKQFDGSHTYEHADVRKGFHPDWKTCIYNYGRAEVRSFLLSNAMYWMDEFHIDGLRVDAVASMLYLDYSREAGEWLPNEFGGRENLEAVSLLKEVNSRVYFNYPGAMMVAEESTAWPGVSRPTSLGGLGFGFKWNMGWMNDTLQYMERDPIHRQFHHSEMTFGLVYAFSENFILPLSHDEVVHGKGSLIGKMPGDVWQKFANLRAYLGFMWAHPGKKLLFMGGEFGQFAEWNHDQSLDWHLLDESLHGGVQNLVKDLNKLYRSNPSLYELDCENGGFQWLESQNAADSVFAFLRSARAEDASMLVVCNMTPTVRSEYRIGVPQPGHYVECLNSDAELYGGSNAGNQGGVEAVAIGYAGQPYSVSLTVPPLATIFLEHRGN